jgi:4-diphosphocytidyl-2-C-methyl-D-erythritol kinase
MGLRVAANAKLNLSLSIVGRRANGLHELAGVMALVDLADELLLLPGCAGLRITGAADASLPVRPEENLAWRGLAAGLGAEPIDCCLTLEKRIPAAAGLGGGSSDAAAAWRLGRRWSGDDEVPTTATLHRLAAIGADVPFFAAGHPLARVGGIGERIEALTAPAGLPRGVLLVHPRRPLSTAAVFAELRRGEWSGAAEPGAGLPGANDLLAPALRLRPELADLMARVRAAGLDPHLTGSGPTLFALTDDDERARAAAARLGSRAVRTTLTRLSVKPARIEVLEASLEEES